MEERHSKAELLKEMDAAWTRLNAALDRLTPEQMTTIRDPEGWTVKDHLAHLAAWERSVMVFLEGRPRYEGLGVEEQVYETGDFDTINAAIQVLQMDVSLSEALADLRAVHAKLVSLIEPMSDDDLYKPGSAFQPEGTPNPDERPIIGMIHGNSADHFREHLAWIGNLVSRA